MAANAPRQNYFVLLGLDPDAPWNDAAFRDLLTRKKAEWTRNARNPKNAKLYNSYLEQVPRIVAVMNDPAARHLEAESARRALAEDMARRREAFQNDFELYAAKDFITPQEIATLAQQYAGFITEAGVRAYMAERGVREITQPETTLADTADILDPSTMQNIQSNLDLLDKRDLYDFLGLSAAAPTALLLDKARAIYAENQKQGDKTSRVTASSELAGQAISIFKDDATRRRYDNALAQAVYDDLGRQVARLVAGTNRLYAPQVRRLLEMARARNLDVDEAREYIVSRARELRAAVEIGGDDQVRQQQRCTNCGTLNDSDARNCRSCGTPLRIECPNCGEDMPTEYRACTNCAFPIGNMTAVIQQIEAGRKLIQARQHAEAAAALRAARDLWSVENPRRPLADPLTRELERYLRQAEEAVAAQQQQIEAIRSLIAERRFYAARDLLNQAGGQPVNLKAEREQIGAAISAAEMRLRQAASAPPDAAASLYLDILNDCADCQPARQALARLPLLPPQGLTARVGSEVVTLDWQPSPSARARYAVVRRADAPPAHAGDGDLLATVIGTHYDDLNPEIGRPLHYAVFAERANLYSREAARLDPPVLLVRGVPQPTLTAQVDDGCVRLRWTPPPNVSEVIVVRSEAAPPRSPADGQPVPVRDLSQAEDSTPVNGRLYHYGVFAIFRDHAGRPVYAPGAFISATPEAAPRPIENLTISARRSASGHDLRLNWTPPDKGSVFILQSERPTGLRSGQVIPEHDLRLYGTLHQASGSHLATNIASGRTAYFTPVVVFRKTAYIGPEHYFAGVEDVTNLRAHNDSVALHLTWDWPAGCDRAIVAYAYDRYPEAEGYPGDGAVRLDVARPQYDLHGGVALPNPVLEDYHIVVYAVYTRNGERILAPGQGSARRLVPLKSRISVAYEVVRPRGLFGGRAASALSIMLTGAGNVPALLLVRKQGGVPINKTDGEVILRLPAFPFTGPTAAYTEGLPAGSAARPHSYVKLFLEDDSLYDTRGGYIRIDHPLTDKLRLS